MFTYFDGDDSVMIVSLSKQTGSARLGDREMTTATIGCFPTRNAAILANNVTSWDVGSLVADLVRHDIGLSNDDKEMLVEIVKEKEALLTSKLGVSVVKILRTIKWQYSPQS